MPFQQENDTIDYSHLVDEYKEPLYVYPRDDPSQRMKDAYASQKLSRQSYIQARKQREEYELTMSDKLGKLHNLLRESKEREIKALRVVREKAINVYEMELMEKDGVGEFNDMMSRLKVFLRKYKSGLPSRTLEEEEMEEDGQSNKNKEKYGADYNEGKVLAQWIHDMQTNYSTLGPHQLAALDNIGVTIPLNEKDNWYAVLVKFQLYSEVYYNTPIKVQNTNGDILLSIMNETDNERYEQLKSWCKAQQEQYELNGFQDNMDRYTKLVEAGFKFDVNVNDDEWTNNVKLVKEYRNKFGNVHIPEDYARPKSSATPVGEEEEDATSSQTSPNKLKEFVTKVRKLLYDDALSPNRMVDLKKANLYLDMGGRVYEYHVKYCKLGREERGEKQRTKRKFEILDALTSSQKGQTVKKRAVRRNNFDNWKEKLEKCVAYKNEHGSLLDVQGDVKLRLWVFSLIRKLSINSAALKGEKMRLIQSHEGLKDFLLQKEYVETANADYKAFLAKQKQKEEAARGRRGGDDDDGKEEKELDALNVLLGNEEEDHELSEFMKSKAV